MATDGETLSYGFPLRDAPGASAETVLQSSLCALDALVLRKDAVFRVEPTPQALEKIALDPQAQWEPSPSGRHRVLLLSGKPEGATSRVMAVAVSDGKDATAVRIFWHGDFLVRALRDLEDAHWERVPRRFVAAALAAHRLGRTCYGAEGPVLAANIPWKQGIPTTPPPPLTGEQVGREALALVKAMAEGRKTDFPPRGTDAYRVAQAAGRLVWQPEWAARIAAALSRQREKGLAERPEELIHAVAMHIAFRGVREVEVKGLRIRPRNAAALAEIWAQYAEWLHGDVPEGFVRWLHPDGMWGPGVLPDEPLGTDPELCTALERSLVAEARQQARYVPYGAFVLRFPEALPVLRFVSDLLLWVEGDRIWCGLRGRDGNVGESFLWTASDGVATPLMVHAEGRAVLGAVLAALWHDMAVAGEEALPEREPSRRDRPAERRPPGLQESAPKPASAVFPGRRRAVRDVELSGVRSWGGLEDRVVVRRAHAVRGHLRKLHQGWAASEDARTHARSYGMVLPDGYTFVRPHVRGGKKDGPVGREGVQVEVPTVKARGLVTLTALLSPGGRETMMPPPLRQRTAMCRLQEPSADRLPVFRLASVVLVRCVPRAGGRGGERTVRHARADGCARRIAEVLASRRSR